MTSYWHYQNTELFSPELQQAVKIRAIETARRHGPDPATRTQASAHEAGHVVVATALGERVRGARIFSKSGRWVGANRRESSTSQPTLVLEDPLSAIAAVCNNLAGISGEILSRCHHPSSSIDERMRAEQILVQLSFVLGVSCDQLKEVSALLVKKVIESNSLSFDVIKNHLYHKRRLLPGEAKRMLVSVKPIDLFFLVGDDRRKPEVFVPMLFDYVGGSSEC